MVECGARERGEDQVVTNVGRLRDHAHFSYDDSLVEAGEPA